MDDQQRKSRVRRNALWLAAAAFGVYLTYALYLYYKMHNG